MKVIIVSGFQGSGKTTFINQLIENENIDFPILMDYPSIVKNYESYKQFIFNQLDDVDNKGHLFVESQDFVAIAFFNNEIKFYETTLRLFRTYVDTDGAYKVYEIGTLPF